jgi:hypothetical protein
MVPPALHEDVSPRHPACFSLGVSTHSSTTLAPGDGVVGWEEDPEMILQRSCLNGRIALSIAAPGFLGPARFRPILSILVLFHARVTLTGVVHCSQELFIK